MSFIYQDLRDRERTCIKENVKFRSKYMCSEIPYDPVKMTGWCMLEQYQRLPTIVVKVGLAEIDPVWGPKW